MWEFPKKDITGLLGNIEILTKKLRFKVVVYNKIRKFANKRKSMKTATPHIVQYQGSKRILAPQILQYMPRHFHRLIEPFAGMAAITIAVAQFNRADKFIVNDINAPIVKILKEAINAPKSLLKDYTKIWNEQFSYTGGSIEHYYKVRDDFNNGAQSPANMLYLLARCVKGSVRYSSSGEFNQSPDKRRNGTSPKTLEYNINRISQYLKGRTEFYSLDYKDVLAMAVEGDVVYMDPPYQGVTNVRDSRYISGLNYDDFVMALGSLNKKNVDYIISYDGMCGDKSYGKDLPSELKLKKVLLKAGLSSQAILLGKKETTYEALYVSQGLWKYMPKEQIDLFQEVAAV